MHLRLVKEVKFQRLQMERREVAKQLPSKADIFRNAFLRSVESVANKMYEKWKFERCFYKEELLERQRFVDSMHSVDDYRNTKLHQFAQENNLTYLLACLCGSNKDIHLAYMVNRTNAEGDTPLMLAVKNRHVEACRILLNFGANASYRRDVNCFTPLHLAASYATKEIAELLVANHANPTEVYHNFFFGALCKPVDCAKRRLDTIEKVKRKKKTTREWKEAQAIYEYLLGFQ